MKVYIKQTGGYVVDLVTRNPDNERYEEHEAGSFPPNVCNGCYQLVNGAFVLDEAKQAEMEYAAMSAVEKLARITVNSTNLTDKQALSVKELFPAWKAGETYQSGYKLQHENRLFKARQNVTSQEHQPPGSEGMGAIYEEINETNSGAQNDPIPYDPVAGMELTEGLYYSQNDIVYLCIRSSGQPLYHNLSALVGHYVQVV